MSTDPATATGDRNPSNYCYRHPDRESYILCQRCGRTICPACQTQAAVGFHCPECVRDARASTPRTRPAILRSARRIGSTGGPVVTYSLIGVTFLAFLLQLVSAGVVTRFLAYFPVYTSVEPWTMITSVFAHSTGSFLHILFNMLSLFIFGRILEQIIGPWRFLALYLLSGFGGSVAVLLLNPAGGAIGASGAIFGLLGAFFIIQRGFGGNSLQLVVMIVLNLAIGFIVPGVAWQAHVGGLLVGGIVAFVYVRNRGRQKQNRQILLTALVFAALVATTVIGVNTLFSR